MDHKAAIVKAHRCWVVIKGQSVLRSVERFHSRDHVDFIPQEEKFA